MLSPSDLVSRVGVGGGLLPFFKCVCAYFLVGAGAAPGAGAVAAKCAPVLCLLAAVLLLKPRPPDGPHAPHAAHDDEALEQYHKDNRRYARLVALGLAASALGDACLVYPGALAGGMALFGAAHVCYMRALAAPAGALLFVLSDAVLGYSLFAGPVPHKQVVVMSTYYLGQLGIALSALLPPPPAPPAALPRPPSRASLLQ